MISIRELKLYEMGNINCGCGFRRIYCIHYSVWGLSV